MKGLLATVCIMVVFPYLNLLGQTRVGADILLTEHLDLVLNRKVGLVTNQTALCADGEHLLDALRRSGITVVRLFGPEHGIRGLAGAGQAVRDSLDPATGIPVISLYGKTGKPTPVMLKGIDVLVYDIQDVGVRFYTYISTMILCMEAAAEQGIPFVVLDRPDPLGGLRVEGPVMEDSLRSFVGQTAIPVIYGLTCGELARYVNEEGLLRNGVKAQLTVVPMRGWKRSMLWQQTGLSWVPPSPNLPGPESALVYPATCFLESTNISEGRGTPMPFQLIGAPFINSKELTRALAEDSLPGIRFDTARFTPEVSKYKGEICQGVRLEVTDPVAFSPLRTGLSLLRQVQRLYPRDFRLNRRGFLRLMGSSAVYDQLVGGFDVKAIMEGWKLKTDAYRVKRTNSLLYP